ncbi:MAG: hypothetical protein CME91_01025 [Hyphomonadaceae bacterium]|nr:hypothetical protein [Hyphomonadaceae bacterium]MBA29103.1 hypothetical protein [Hyphomonadaceae bacterium]
MFGVSETALKRPVFQASQYSGFNCPIPNWLIGLDVVFHIGSNALRLDTENQKCGLNYTQRISQPPPRRNVIVPVRSDSPKSTNLNSSIRSHRFVFGWQFRRANFGENAIDRF